MRRDGTMTVVNIKTERLSTDAKTDKPRATVSSTTSNESVRPVRIKKEKIDDTTTSKSNKTNGLSETKKNSIDDLNDSLEIVPMETNPTIELSDDENGNDGNKMPPPAFVPPIKGTKDKKLPTEKKTTRSTRSKQPKRKVFISFHSLISLCHYHAMSNL